jgi:hypothetical protein
MPKVPRTNEPNEPNKQNVPYVFTGTGLLFGISTNSTAPLMDTLSFSIKLVTSAARGDAEHVNGCEYLYDGRSYLCLWIS